VAVAPQPRRDDDARPGGRPPAEVLVDHRLERAGRREGRAGDHRQEQRRDTDSHEPTEHRILPCVAPRRPVRGDESFAIDTLRWRSLLVDLCQGTDTVPSKRNVRASPANVAVPVPLPVAPAKAPVAPTILQVNVSISGLP